MKPKSLIEAKKIVDSMIDETDIVGFGEEVRRKELIRRIKRKAPQLSEDLIIEALKEIQEERA